MVENGPTPYYLKFRECFETGNKWPFAFRFHVAFVTFRRKKLPFWKRRKTVRYINILLRESEEEENCKIHKHTITRKLCSFRFRAGFNCQNLQGDKELMYCVLWQ